MLPKTLFCWNIFEIQVIERKREQPFSKNMFSNSKAAKMYLKKTIQLLNFHTVLPF